MEETSDTEPLAAFPEEVAALPRVQQAMRKKFGERANGLLKDMADTSQKTELNGEVDDFPEELIHDESEGVRNIDALTSEYDSETDGNEVGMESATEN